jgi:hypothetical protein
MKMEQVEYSETSAYKIQTPENYPEENLQNVKLYCDTDNQTVHKLYCDILTVRQNINSIVIYWQSDKT